MIPFIDLQAQQRRIRAELEERARRFLVEKKTADTMAVVLIDEVSRILPDHTWIARLDLTASEMQLQGQSSNSSSLIAIIEASPYFEHARFGSPVVQITGTANDRFHIIAGIVSLPAADGEESEP